MFVTMFSLALSFSQYARADYGSVAWGRENRGGREFIWTGMGRGSTKQAAIDDAINNCQRGHLTVCQSVGVISQKCLFIVRGTYATRADAFWAGSFEAATKICQSKGYTCTDSERIGMCIGTPDDDVEYGEDGE